jgi:COPII coat assembly protein SEC16
MTKPSLDSIGTWLEGRFTKLITGDGDSPASPSDETVQREQSAFSGPFSHYSEISSSNSSNVPSPQSSMINLNALPPRRSGSAMSIPSASINHHIDRASSAMDHLRRRPSPGPHMVSGSATVSNFSQSVSFGQAINGYVPSTTSYSGESIDLMTPTLDMVQKANDIQSPAWWSSSFNASSANATPVATTFVPSEDSPKTSTDSWVEETTPRDSSGQGTSDQLYDDPEEDLGLGNSKPKVANGQAENPPPEAEKKIPEDASKSFVQFDWIDPKTMELETPEGGTTSWFSRWWKRSDSRTPIKANLGEDTSFYYDKELKRWVNKSVSSKILFWDVSLTSLLQAGSEPEKPAAVPPPSRVQTASPGRSKPPRSSSPVPIQPPLRSASAIDLSISPPSKPPPRMRSNLAPPPEAESESPAMSQEAGPPPGRPKSQASKRNVRSRYVDVFQQGP